MSDTFFPEDADETGKKRTQKMSARMKSDYDTTHEAETEKDDEGTLQKLYPVQMRIRQLFEKQIHTDVTFYDQSDKHSHISAHKIILASESTFFEKLLFSDNDSSAQLEIEISNMPFDVFKVIIKYLYTDEIPDDSSIVLDILDGALRFEIKSLEDVCLKSLRTVPISEKNVCSLLQLSMERKIKSLKADCNNFIQNNTSAVLRSPEFKTAELGVIIEICSLETLNLESEVKLLEAILDWTHSCKEREQHLKNYELLKEIRFLTFTHEEFANTVSKHNGLIKENDALKILIFLNTQDDLSNLPKWCNLQTTSRCQSGTDVKKQEKGFGSFISNMWSSNMNLVLHPVSFLQKFKRVSGGNEQKTISFVERGEEEKDDGAFSSVGRFFTRLSGFVLRR